jgi:hypothetical protein
MINKFNVSKPEKYIKNGEEKTFWANVGTMTEFIKEDNSVSRVLEIPAIGLKAQIFPMVAKTAPASPQSSTQGQVDTSVDYPEEDINPEDIPF